MSDDSMEIDSDDDRELSLSDTNNNLIAGKIATIHLQNFLTHSEATVHPSEQLNLVIGPNGTGKSTIVAGIIIGMGVSTKILSATNKLVDYVKNGKEEAKITVTVYKDDRRNRITFCREFNRQNKSTYTIDGRKVTEKQYVEAISLLNIQVSNLCQFLPQERVQDFAKQNPQELFASTQKSVNGELIESFNKLKELRYTQLNGDKNVKQTEGLLRDNENRVELLQSSVDNIRRQDALVRRKDVIEKKLAWMDFEEAYLKCKEIEKDLDVAKKNYVTAVKKRDELMKHVESKAKERKQFETSLSNETNKKMKRVEELNRTAAEIERLESQIQRAKADLDSVIQSADEREGLINENRMILRTYEQDRDNFFQTNGSIEEIQEHMKNINESVENTRKQIHALTETRNKMNTHIETVIKPRAVHIDNRIAALNSVAEAKLNFLQTNFSDVYTAVMWLRENESMFRGRIYEPMLLEVNVRSNEYCKYIENTASGRDMIAFICEETDDMNRFLKIMRVEKGLNINAVHSPAADSLRYKSTVPIGNLRKLGAEIYLIDCLEAPFPILNYLCQAFKFHEVLIGNENLERKANMLPKSVLLFFTPASRVQIKVSKYSGEKSLMSSLLKAKNLLNVRVDPRELETLHEQKSSLSRERDQLYNKRSDVETNINVLEKKGFIN